MPDPVVDKFKKIIYEWTFSETKHDHTNEIINHNESKNGQPNLLSKTQYPLRMNLIVHSWFSNFLFADQTMYLEDIEDHSFPSGSVWKGKKSKVL